MAYIEVQAAPAPLFISVLFSRLPFFSGVILYEKRPGASVHQVALLRREGFYLTASLSLGRNL